MIKAIKGQSVSLIPSNQSDFNDRNLACSNDNERYCQSVIKKQFTEFQVKLLPATNIELVSNENFATNLTGWTPSGFMAQSHSNLYGGSASLSSTGLGTLNQTITGLTIGKYYRGEILFRDFTRQSLLINAFSAISVILPTPITFLRTPIILYNINQNVNIRDKKVIFWFLATSTSHQISIQIQNATVIAEYVSMMELTIPTAKVRTCEDEEVFNAGVRLFKDNAIIGVNWNDTDIIEGECYKICVFPDGNNSTNLFSNLNAITDNFFNTIVDNNRVPIIGG